MSESRSVPTGGHPARATLRVIGASAVLGALLALCLPLQLGAVDRGGNPIGCGRGLAADTVMARRIDAVNQQQRAQAGPAFVASDYAGECAAAVADRRWVAMGVAATGVVILLGTLIDPLAGGADRSQRRQGRPDWVTGGTAPIRMDDRLSRA